jgi:hypothetical protein
MKFLSKALLATSLLMTTPVFAGDWKTVDAETSVAFGSIKKDTVGEVHHFNKVTGSVSEDGKLKLDIDLASLETNIDIRNERMTKHVFLEGAATASLTGEIDMSEINDLKIGETRIIEIEAVLSFVGVENDIDTNMLVARLGENRVLVSTADFVMLSTEDLEIDPGINKLMELAKLPGITRVTPISARMVFEK